MLVVRDVPRSSRFYQQVLDAESGHGGDEYDQIVSNGRILCSCTTSMSRTTTVAWPTPNNRWAGVLVWFEVADFEAAVKQVRATGASVVRDVHANPNARQQEVWVREPDGYLVVLAGSSDYRRRSGSR